MKVTGGMKLNVAVVLQLQRLVSTLSVDSDTHLTRSNSLHRRDVIKKVLLLVIHADHAGCVQGSPPSIFSLHTKISWRSFVPLILSFRLTFIFVVGLHNGSIFVGRHGCHHHGMAVLFSAGDARSYGLNDVRYFLTAKLR